MSEPSAPAQDPWAGTFVPGVASVPDSAADVVWSPPQERGGGAGRYVLTFFAVLILGGGAGFGSWFATGKVLVSGAEPSPTTTSLVKLTTCAQDNGFDPCALTVGQCFINLTPTATPTLEVVDCSTPNRYRIGKILWGEEIQPGGIPQLTVEQGDALRDTICVDGVGRSYYAFNNPDDEGGDRFICMGKDL